VELLCLTETIFGSHFYSIRPTPFQPQRDPIPVWLVASGDTSKLIMGKTILSFLKAASFPQDVEHLIDTCGTDPPKQLQSKYWLNFFLLFSITGKFIASLASWYHVNSLFKMKLRQPCTILQ